MAFEDHLRIEPTDSPERWRCTFSPFVLTPRRALQGGVGLAIALQAAEALTGRPPVWATAQYLSFAVGTEPVDVEVRVEAEGQTTTQARCVVSRGGNEILMAVMALGTRDFAPGGTWVDRPLLPAPDDCPPFRFLSSGEGHLGDILEVRLAHGRQLADLHGRPGGAAMAWWCRVTYGRHVPGAGELALVGDFLPVAFSEPYGRRYAGTGIDNTLRMGLRAETEWVLLDCRLEQVANGFGYGRAHLWSEDGVLLGTATQTMSMRLSDRIELDTEPPRRTV